MRGVASSCNQCYLILKLNLFQLEEWSIAKYCCGYVYDVYIGLSGYMAFFWWKPALAASLVQRLTSSFLAAVNQTPRRCGLMVIGGKTREDRSRVSSTSSESLSDGQMTCGCCFHCLSKEERHGIEKKALQTTVLLQSSTIQTERTMLSTNQSSWQDLKFLDI